MLLIKATFKLKYLHNANNLTHRSTNDFLSKTDATITERYLQDALNTATGVVILDSIKHSLKSDQSITQGHQTRCNTMK